MEIPHFFLNTPLEIPLIFIDSWNFHIPFFSVATPGNSISSAQSTTVNPPVVFVCFVFPGMMECNVGNPMISEQQIGKTAFNAEFLTVANT